MVVTDRLDHDYGIDAEVEFTENNQMTGRTFLVQLKSTERVGGTPKVRVSLTTLNYWRSLDRLVLLVLWEEEGNRFWARWAHRIDVYGLPEAQQTLTVAFETGDVLDALSWDRIDREVQFLRIARRKELDFPLALRVRSQGAFGEHSAGQVRALVQKSLRDYRDLFHTVTGDEYVIDSRMARGVLTVESLGQPASVLHYGKHGPSPDRIASDFFLALAHQLENLGAADAAARLVLAHWEQSNFAFQGLEAFCARSLAGCGAIDDAIRLAWQVDAENSFPVPMTLIALASDSSTKRWTDKTVAAVEAWVAEQSANRGAPDPDLAVALGAARGVLGASDHERSYQIAIMEEKLDPRLLVDAHFQRIVAGHAFLSAHSEDAVVRYRRALDGGEQEVETLLADALLWSGEYSSAVDVWHGCAALEGEYQAKVECFVPLLDALGVTTQRRDTFIAERTWFESVASLNACLEALRSDLLFAPALAWLSDYLLFEDVREQSDPVGEEDAKVADSLQSFGYHVGVCAALAYPSITSLWSRVLLIGPASGQGLYRNVARAANRMCGSEIVADLFDRGLIDEAEAVERVFETYGSD